MTLRHLFHALPIINLIISLIFFIKGIAPPKDKNKKITAYISAAAIVTDFIIIWLLDTWLPLYN